MTLVSRSSASPATTGNGDSGWPAISADGRYVAFSSSASDLVPDQDDTSFGPDVFLYDRDAGTTTLVSRSSASGAAAGGNALRLSADGRYVAFTSFATDLVAGQSDTGFSTDVFLYDRVSGTMALVSHSHTSATTAASGHSSSPVLSADGRWIAFTSSAANLVAGQTDPNGQEDAFLYDRDSGAVALVSRSSASPTTAGNEDSFAAGISADGGFVLFGSRATDLFPGQDDQNGSSDVFLFERSSGTTTLVSRSDASPTTTSNAESYAAALSGDAGRIAYFRRTPSGESRVLLFDRAAGTTQTVQTAVTSFFPGPFFGLLLSQDGAYLAFTTSSTNLGSVNDTNTALDAMLYERATATLTVLSQHAPGMHSLTPHDGASTGGLVSADGRWVAFTSQSSRLVPGQQDWNFFPSSGDDVFLYDRYSGTVTLVSRSSSSPTTTATALSSLGGLSADGRYVVFSSHSHNVVANQDDHDVFSTDPDVFLYDRVTGTTTLVSRSSASPTTTGTGESDFPVISADGRYIAFLSTARDLLPGPPEGDSDTDVFLYDRATGTMTRVGFSGTPFFVAPREPLALSGDGRFVAFRSLGDQVIPGQIDANGAADLFLYDRDTGETLLVSHAAGSPQTTADAGSSPAVLSADGRFVAFASAATNLVPGQDDTNTFPDVFLFDRTTGTTALISGANGSATKTANGGSYSPKISADGGVLGFTSDANNLIPGQAPNQTAGLFLRVGDTTQLLMDSDVTTHSGPPFPELAISADGRRAAFSSTATDLVPGQTDTAGSYDLFLYDRIADSTSLVSRSLAAETAAAGAFDGGFALSANGGAVVFTSLSADLIANDFNGFADVFLYTEPPAGRDFFTVAPCRLIDTRQPGQGPALASGVSEIWTIHGACGIPATAKAVSVNVTITQPTGAGHLSFAPGDLGDPPASTINFGPGQTRANNAVLPLALNGLGTLRVSPFVTGNGTVHVLLDVNGYFE